MLLPYFNGFIFYITLRWIIYFKILLLHVVCEGKIPQGNFYIVVK